ncbi:hypothetical protein Efla_003293 [Eimeria flavescens]
MPSLTVRALSKEEGASFVGLKSSNTAAGPTAASMQEKANKAAGGRKSGGSGRSSVRLAWDRFFRLRVYLRGDRWRGPSSPVSVCHLDQQTVDVCLPASQQPVCGCCFEPWVQIGVYVQLRAVETETERHVVCLCLLVLQGECTNLECNFAHGAEELRHTTGYYKTELCQLWLGGGCPSGEVCRHAHGVDELRPKTAEAIECRTISSSRLLLVFACACLPASGPLPPIRVRG